MTESEVTLWRAWERGHDQAAFERLVRPHLRFLQDFARRAGCGADADDAVQTALVELAEARGGRPPRVPLRAWLGRSVLQQARMLHRARGRRARHEAAAARPERVDPKPSAHDEVERALARLDPDARLAVELRYLHDLDYKEVAHVLKASEIACRIRVHRAIARLRRDLGKLAPALIAALPLLGGDAEARTALARNAAARAGTWIGGGLLMATKLKIAAVALLALAVFLLWQHAREESPPPARSVASRTAPPAEAATTEAASAVEPHASGREGVPGAAGGTEEEEPPLAPGNGCVRGLIRFEDGEPLKGARVSLWGASEVYATTDEEGRFHLHDDWVAEREIYLSGPNGVRGADPFGFLLGPKVRMVAGETVRVEIVLERGAPLAARVVSALTGDPVVGAEISFRRWDGDALKQDAQGGYGCARTDAQGTFAFDHVVPAEYALTIAAKGFEAQHAHWDLRKGALPDLFRMEAARRLEIRIRNAPPGAVGTAVKWMLRSSPELIVTGAVPTYRQEYLILDGEAVMQADGLLVGEAPPPGSYDLTIWGTKRLPRIERKIECGRNAVEIAEIALDPGARVEGTVRLPGGSPVAHARVMARGLSRETDGEGRYAFEWMPGAVDGASTEFSVRLDGAELRLGARTFGQGDPKAMDLVLPGSGTLRFELKGGVAAQDGMVELWREGGDDAFLERRFRLPLDGPVVLRGLPPDPLRLNIEVFDGSHVRREVRVGDTTMDLGVIELPVWPRLEIRVRVPEGTALPQWVRVSHPDPDAPVVRGEALLLDAEGRGLLPALPPGERQITVESGNVRVEVKVTVDPDRPTPVDVLLAPK